MLVAASPVGAVLAAVVALLAGALGYRGVAGGALSELVIVAVAGAASRHDGSMAGRMHCARPRTISYRATLRGDQGTGHTAACGR